MSTEMILTNLTTETLAEMAAEKAALVEQHGRKTVQAAIDCGRYLTEIKSRLGHGEWLPWLAENWQYTQQWANQFMRLANYNSTCNLSDAKDIKDALRILGEAEEAAGTKRTRKAAAVPAPEVEVIDNRPAKPVEQPQASRAMFEDSDDLPPEEPPPLPKTNTLHSPATRQQIDRGPEPAPAQPVEDAYGMPLLEVVISNHTAQEVVDALIAGLQGREAHEVAAILRVAANKLDPLATVAAEPPPAKPAKAGKHPTAEELIRSTEVYEDDWSGPLMTQVKAWATYKQSLVGNAKVRSLQSWAAALSRIDNVQKMRGPGTVCEMINKAIANGWQGWEHDSGNGKSTIASTRIDTGEDYSDLTYRTV
jgi:hypothetical protein